MTIPEPPDEPPASDHRDQVLIAIQRVLRHLGNRVDVIEKRTAPDRAGSRRGDGKSDPASWVWSVPPTGSEDVPEAAPDPRVTIANFVTWYNAVYTGPGTRARAIPTCWRNHLGLVHEIAALAYDWRDTNLGPAASAREAVLWHHVRRPGFEDRMFRLWVPESCLDGEHSASPNGGASRFDRPPAHDPDTDNPEQATP